MTTLNAATIEAILATFERVCTYTGRDGREVSYTESGWDEWRWASRKNVDGDRVPDLGRVLVVEAEGGGEGEGEHVHLVFKITGDDGSVRYFRKDGFYASYDGTTWDDGEQFFEVTPVEKTVTVFDKVA